MIGYYVHHVGRGHLHRAQAVAAEIGPGLTGLSSLPRPEGWAGDWVRLPRDDAGPAAVDATAGGTLHWVPVGDAGLRARMAALSAWIHRAGPSVLVADVSVEVAALARLHGIPVVSVVLPGRRVDDAHALGYALSTRLVAAWPPTASPMLPGLPDDLVERVEAVGGISRFAVVAPAPRRPGPPRVVALLGQGGGAPSPALLARARSTTPDWSWTVLGGAGATWVADPSTALRDADVVVCQAGQNSIAEIAATRRPAVVVPADRPHDEQRVMGGALSSGGWPVVVEPTFPRRGWAELLSRAAALDGSRWAQWCDGRGAARLARVLTDLEHDERVAS